MEAVIAICVLADRGAGSDVVGNFVTKKLLIGLHFLAAKTNWDSTDLPIVGSFVGGVRRAPKLLSVSAFRGCLGVYSCRKHGSLPNSSADIARLTARFKYLFSNGTVLTMYVCLWLILRYIGNLV